MTGRPSRGPEDPRDPRDERRDDDPRDPRDMRRKDDPRDPADLRLTLILIAISLICLIASVTIAFVLITVRSNDLADIQAQFRTDQQHAAAAEQEFRQESDRRRAAFCAYFGTREDLKKTAAGRDLAQALNCGTS